jgi:thymidylate synthase
MNMFGFIQFNKEVIAAEVNRRTGKEVRLGRLNWQADSYHIYGKDIAQARAMLFDRIDTMRFEERTFSFSDEYIRQMYDDAEIGILQKIRDYDASHCSGPDLVLLD